MWLALVLLMSLSIVVTLALAWGMRRAQESQLTFEIAEVKRRIELAERRGNVAEVRVEQHRLRALLNELDNLETTERKSPV